LALPPRVLGDRSDRIHGDLMDHHRRMADIAALISTLTGPPRSKEVTMQITIPTDAAELAADHGIDPEAVARNAIADAIEAAVLRAADEAANTARQEALA